jgi:hypothetical protein
MSDEWEDVPAASSSSDGWEDIPKQKPAGLLDRKEGDGWLTGALKGGATAVMEGVADIPGAVGNIREANKFLSDRVGMPIAAGVVNAVRYPLGYDTISTDDLRAARDRGYEKIDDKNSDIRNWFKTGDQIAAPVLEKTGKYEPDSTVGKMAKTAVRAVTGSGASAVPAKAGLLEHMTEDGGKILKDMYSRNMVGATAGAAATGELATEATGDPLFGMAAGFAGPAAAGKAGKFALKVGAPALEDIPGINRWAQGTRERLAAEDLLRKAHNPEAVMDWARGDGSHPGLDKFPFTLGQATGDPGILNQELAAQTVNKDNFAGRMKDKAGEQTARLHGEVSSMSPETADPMAVTDAFTQRYNRITEKYQQTEDALRQRAQEAIAALGDSPGAAAVGEQLRTAIAENDKKLKAEVSELYKGVNSNKDMRVIIDVGTKENPSVREVAEKFHSDRVGATKYDKNLEEMIQLIREAPSVWDFEELRGVDERLSKAMEEARNSQDRAQLGILKNAVKNTINQAVDNQINWKLANDIPLDAHERRIRQSHEGFAVPGDASPSAGESVAATGTDARSPMAVHPASGEGRSAEFGFGDANSGQGLAPQTGETKLYYPGGNHITARPKIVELDDLHISHNDDFTENPRYPQELQPRDRDIAQAQEQVNKYAGSEWAPDRYGMTNDANSGAPVIGSDGVVESGNGRTMALRRRYDQGDTSYKDYLASQGYDVSGFNKPVLAMERTTEFGTPEARQQYTHLVNRESGLGLGTKEQASSDARFLTPEDIYKLKEGPLTSEANSGFMRAFLGRLTSGDRARVIDGKGGVTQRGIDRAQAAIVQRAYGNDAVLRRGFEATDNNAKNVTGALTDAAGPWAKMRQAVEDGTIDKSHDITDELMNGVDKIIRARDEGRPVSEILDQIDAFASPVTKDVYRLLFDGDKVASRQKIAARLNKYAADSVKNEGGGFGFGETRDPKHVLSDAQNVVVEGEEAASAGAKAPGQSPKTGDGMVIPEKLRPNITQGQADLLNEANTKYGKMKDTLKPANRMLEKRMGGEYDQAGSAIPATVIKAGDTGYQTAQSFLKAAANAPEAATAMREMILDRFRKAVGRNGTIDPNKWSNLQRDYAGAIRAVEEQSPGLAKMLKTPESTADALANFGKERDANIKALQKEEAAKFLGKENEVEVQNAIGEIINGRNPSVTKLRDMVETLKAENPDALDGLRQATIDWIVRKDTNASRTTKNDDVFSYAKINTLLKEKSHLLQEILTPEQMNTLRAMRETLAMVNRSTDRTRIPASPGTAKDMGAHFEKLGRELADKSVLFLAFDTVANGASNPGMALLKGAGVFTAGSLYRLRQMGIDTVGDIQREMFLHPEVARAAFKRVKGEHLPKQGDALVRAIRNAYLNSGANVEREQRASGGRLAFASGGKAPKRKPMTPEQIIAGIAKARKAEQKRTEVILDKPDEAVVRALSMANQHL